jgi:hypothetical protein
MSSVVDVSEVYSASIVTVEISRVNECSGFTVLFHAVNIQLDHGWPQEVAVIFRSSGTGNRRGLESRRI